MRSRVADHRSRGYRAHSVKIGASEDEGGASLDAARIAACLADRRRGEIFIVDANGGLVPETALRMLHLLPAGLDFVLEAPCATWRETQSLRRRCAYPIVLDELALDDADIAAAVAQDTADGISIKISKAGGLTRGRRHRDIARAAGLTTSVQDTVGSQIAFAAVLHLAATFVPRLLRGAQNCADMVTRRTADFAPIISEDGILPPSLPDWDWWSTTVSSARRCKPGRDRRQTGGSRTGRCEARVRATEPPQAYDATGAPKTPSSGVTPSPGPGGTRMCPPSTAIGCSES
jgi:L-alanine-DL-glutamate epimerase-like enolase superfamily enzyme